MIENHGCVMTRKILFIWKYVSRAEDIVFYFCKESNPPFSCNHLLNKLQSITNFYIGCFCGIGYNMLVKQSQPPSTTSLKKNHLKWKQTDLKFYLKHWLHTKRRFIHIFSLSFNTDLIWQERINLWDMLNIQIPGFPLNYLLCNTFTSWKHVKVNLLYKTKVQHKIHCSVCTAMYKEC